MNLVQHIVVDANPATTYYALFIANLLGDRMSVLLVRARDLPNRLRTRHNGHTQPDPGKAPSTVRFADVTRGDSSWVLLHDEPGVEFLIGLIGQFWHRDYGIVRVRRNGFADFDEPGYAKTLAGLSLRPFVAVLMRSALTTHRAGSRRSRPTPLQDHLPLSIHTLSPNARSPVRDWLS